MSFRAPSAVIVIPAYNAARTLARTLDSALASVAHAREWLPELTAEIAVVDDASTDGTAEIINTAAKTNPEIVPILLPENRGPGFARNEGVRRTTGTYLFFLDADDVFYPPHVHVCLARLLTRDDLGYVYTRVHVDMPMHADWRPSLDDSNPINFCMRRVWHDMIQGFPEEPDFRTYGTEDTLYRMCLRRLVQAEKIEQETCEQFVSPGNALDRQREKFAMPMAEWQAKGIDDGFVLTESMKAAAAARLEHVARLKGEVT